MLEPDVLEREEAKYLGSCHCGAVRFEIETNLPELTMCDCSLCKRRNALMVKVHESKFRLISGAESLTEYQFHTHTARHFFCKTCGIYPFHRKRVTPDNFGINVHCLEGFDPTGMPPGPRGAQAYAAPRGPEGTPPPPGRLERSSAAPMIVVLPFSPEHAEDVVFRSGRTPTAGRQRLAGGTRCIFAVWALASCR